MGVADDDEASLVFPRTCELEMQCKEDLVCHSNKSHTLCDVVFHNLPFSQMKEKNVFATTPFEICFLGAERIFLVDTYF